MLQNLHINLHVAQCLKVWYPAFAKPLFLITAYIQSMFQVNFYEAYMVLFCLLCFTLHSHFGNLDTSILKRLQILIHHIQQVLSVSSSVLSFLSYSQLINLNLIADQFTLKQPYFELAWSWWSQAPNLCSICLQHPNLFLHLVSLGNLMPPSLLNFFSAHHPINPFIVHINNSLSSIFPEPGETYCSTPPVLDLYTTPQLSHHLLLPSAHFHISFHNHQHLSVGCCLCLNIWQYDERNTWVFLTYKLTAHFHYLSSFQHISFMRF